MEYQNMYIDPSTLFHTQSEVTVGAPAVELFACRGCLATEIKFFDIQECDLAGLFEDVTGLPVPRDDGLPQHLCPYCFSLLQKFATFKEKCKRSLEILGLAKQLAGQLTTDYIRLIDRQAEGLALPLTEQANLMYEIGNTGPPSSHTPSAYQVSSSVNEQSDNVVHTAPGTTNNTVEDEMHEYPKDDDMIQITGIDEDNPFSTPGKEFQSVAVPLTHSMLPYSQTMAMKGRKPIGGGYLGCEEALRRSLRRRGTHIDVINRVLGSLTKKMTVFYNIVYQKWFGFCKRHSRDPVELSLPAVLEFLTEQLSKGTAAYAVDRMRLALALLLGSEVNGDPAIRDLFKRSKEIIPLPVYGGTWEVATVLNELATWYPYTSLPLVKLTKKVVVLLALSTTHNARTLARLKVADLTMEEGGVRITAPPECFLPYYWEDSRLCTASCLAAYVLSTAELRVCTNLFINVKSPYGPAADQTVGRWMHRTLDGAGVDMSVFEQQDSERTTPRTSSKSDINISFVVMRRLAVWSDSAVRFARHFEVGRHSSG